VTQELSKKPHVSFDDFNLERLQTFSFARAAHAKAGEWFINGVVRLADKMPALRREKPAAVKIQSQREMAAFVFVRHQLALEAGEKSLRRLAAEREGKFQRAALGHVVRPRDFDFAHARTLYGNNFQRNAHGGEHEPRPLHQGDFTCA